MALGDTEKKEKSVFKINQARMFARGTRVAVTGVTGDLTRDLSRVRGAGASRVVSSRCRAPNLATPKISHLVDKTLLTYT